MRTSAVPTLMFALAGIGGPLLRWITWPPGRVGDGTGFSVSDFLYNLVLLLWPTQPLGVMEASLGRGMAIAISVGANLILFGIAGLIVGIAAKRLSVLVAVYVLICTMMTALALWIAGMHFGDINVVALLVALGFYALLFFATFRLSS